MSLISPTRLYAIMQKEFIQIRRDARSLMMIILLPLMLIILFGYAVTFDVKHVSTTVFDQDKTETSREFIQKFASSQYFQIKSYETSYKSIVEDIDRGRAKIGIVLPPHFAGKLAAGNPADIQIILDGSDPNTANIVLNYLDGILGAYNQTLGIRAGPVSARMRVWFNEEMESKNYVVPGLIAVIMTIIGALLTSLTIAREWERGTMEELISTPVKKLELIIGKLAPYFVLGLLDMAIAVAASRIIFDVPLRGSLAVLVFISSIFMVGSIAFGFFLSVVARNQYFANQLAMLTTFLPAFLLSGFIFPIMNMPWILRMVTEAVPARHLVFSLRAIYLKGLGLEFLWKEAVILLFISLVAIAGSFLKFKKTLD